MPAAMRIKFGKQNKKLIAVEDSCAIAASITQSHCKFRYVSNFTTESCGFPAIARLYCTVGLCRLQWVNVISARKTRQLSYRKEDRVMRPIYGCPEKFWVLTTHPATFPEICNGLLSDRY